MCRFAVNSRSVAAKRGEIGVKGSDLGPKPEDCQSGPRKLALLRLIDDLCAKEKRSFASRHRKTDFYRYLQQVYEIYVDWKARKIAKTKSRQLAALKTIEFRKNTHPVHVLIAASSQATVQVKSRWTQALRFAAKNNVDPDQLLAFFAERGGVSGCARKMAGVRQRAKLQAN